MKALLTITAVVCALSIASSARFRRHHTEDHTEEEQHPIFLNDFPEKDFEDDLKSDVYDVSVVEKNQEEPEVDNGCSPAARTNTDEYIDKVLEEVRPKLPEPAFLPERVGRFKLFNGTLENLTSVRRAGPAMVRCTDTAFSFLVPVRFQNLTGRYYWETDAGVPVFRGLIDLLIGRVDADVMYTRHRQGDRKASVDKFTISKLEGVKVNFDGLGPLNTFASRVTSLVVRFFNRGVSRVLEGPVKSAINKELLNFEKYEKYYF